MVGVEPTRQSPVLKHFECSLLRPLEYICIFNFVARNFPQGVISSATPSTSWVMLHSINFVQLIITACGANVNSLQVGKCRVKKLYSYVTNKNRVGEHNRGSKYAPEKESKGTKMKYEIVGIEHAVGDFTPTSGRNANTVQHYDVYRLHTLKYSKDAYGKITAVVRATPDQMGQIVADLGGNIADVPGHVLDMEIRNSFGKINLTDYEVVR